jgi:hypothetical protein
VRAGEVFVCSVSFAVYAVERRTEALHTILDGRRLVYGLPLYAIIKDWRFRGDFHVR